MSNADLACLAEVSEIRFGMITVRAPHGDALRQALQSAGLDLPGHRQIVSSAAGQVGWMSPDEVLIFTSPDVVAATRSGVAQALAGTHHMVVDVSDARAAFRVDGPQAHQVLAKLCPADLLDGTFPAAELRRTRLAQIPAAFWRDETGYTLVCFRSVAAYARDVLTLAARPGTAIDPVGGAL